MAIVYENRGDAPVSRITPYTMEAGDTFRGTVSDNDVDDGPKSGDDGDLIRIDLSAGVTYRISLTGIGSNPVDDPTLFLLDSNLKGNVAYSYDIDNPDNLDSLIEYTPTSTGTYYIRVLGNDTGDYEIEVSPDLPFIDDYRESPGIDTYDEIVHQLTDDYWESSDRLPRSFSVESGGTLNVDITALTTEGQQLARWALEAWTNVTGIDFRFVDSTHSRIHITFDDSEEGAFQRSTVDSTGRFIISSHVNVSTDWLADLGTTTDSYSFQTYLHEIGHALGLGHPGDYNNNATYGVDNEFLNDSWQATVMSYFDQYGNTDIDADYAYVVSPMIADIIAIQHLYGAPTDINSGNTVYGSNSNVGGYLGEIFALITGEQWDPDLFNGGRSLTLTIYDTGGIDTLDLSAGTTNQVVDLNPGGISDVLGLTGNLSIAFGTVIENFVGGAGNDTVIGNVVANHMEGRDGDDQLWGGGGNDTLLGGEDNDRLIGEEGNDTLIGNAGDDTLWGGRDADTLWGGRGHDALAGGAGNDTLAGGEGNDWINGGAGTDRLIGGAGRDTLDYTGSGAGVTVSLATGMVSGGHAEGDTVSGFEDVAGSAFDDHITGDGGANELAGGRGHDRLTGGAGNDKLIGGMGHDTLFGGRGTDTLRGGGGDDTLYGGDDDDRLIGGDHNDRLIGGAGADTLAGGAGWDTLEYVGSDAGVTVNLATGEVSGGDAEGDTISGFEKVTGSAHGDRITGDGGNNELAGGGGHDALYGDTGTDRLIGNAGHDTLFGGAGNDTLWGGRGDDTLYGGHDDDTLEGGEGDDRLNGGAGADTLVGGSGRDTLDYSWSVDEGVTVNLATGAASGGHAEGDTVSGFEDVIGSQYADVISGDGGANELTGGGGDDRLTGNAGNDRLMGDADNDTLIGNTGNDTLWGGRGNDTLWGGNDDDRLIGGAGADRLTGGAGDDRFVFGRGHGSDTIVQFADGEDLIDLTGFSLSGFSDLTIAGSAQGVTIDLSGHGGGSILLEGFGLANLDESDFLF